MNEQNFLLAFFAASMAVLIAGVIAAVWWGINGNLTATLSSLAVVVLGACGVWLAIKFDDHPLDRRSK